tara:strand:+ start:512 stop:805 length:294 start_codon:yes stop_codon:yes gene_type:complete
MRSGFYDTLLKINNIYDIMDYNILTLSFCGIYFFYINNALQNEINILKKRNSYLQNTIERLKYNLSKKKELTIEPDESSETPRVPSQNDLVLIDRDN